MTYTRSDHISLIAWIVATIAFVGQTHGSRGNNESFDIQSWSAAEHLSQRTVRSFAPDDDGYLWLATDGGLARFNGSVFSEFDITKAPALNSSRFRALCLADNGDLWIGSADGGPARYRQGTFESFQDALHAPGFSIGSIVQDQAGAIWFGGSGVVRLKDGAFQTNAPDGWNSESDNVRSLAVDRNGDVWLACRKGVAHWHRNSWRWLDTNDGLPRRNARFIGVDPAGNVWASGSNWIAVRENDRFQQVQIAGDDPGRIHAAVVDNEGRYWIGSANGLFLWTQLTSESASPSIQLLRAPIKLGAAPVQTLALGPGGKVWAATPESFFRIQDRLYDTIELPQSRPVNWPVFISHSDGDQFLVLQRGQFKAWRDGQWSTPSALAHMHNVNAVKAGPDGAIWIAHDQNTVSRFADNQLETLPHDLGKIKQILVASNGTLWLATEHHGLATIVDGVITPVATEQGAPSFDAFPVVLAESIDGSIWIGAGKNLIKYHQNRYANQPIKNHSFGTEVRSLHETDGVLWVSTYGGGLLRVDGANVVALTTAQGLPSNLLGKIVEDDGTFWINSNSGVIRFELDAANACINGRQSTIAASILKCGEGNGGGGGRRADGSLWFPTLNNIVLIDPDEDIAHKKIPRVHIEYVMVNGTTCDTNEMIEIGPDPVALQFAFSGTCFSHPSQLRFRYMLEGLNDSWVEAGSSRVASFDDLPSGSYRFHVEAACSESDWSEPASSVAITKQTHFYKDGRFIAACLTIVILLGFGLHRLRVSSVHRHNELLQNEILRRHEAEMRLRTLVDSEPECVKSISAEGLLTDMNPTGLLLIEADSMDQVRGLPVLNLVAPEHRTAFQDLHERVLAGESLTLEFEIIGLNGTRRWMETHAAPLRDQHDKIIEHVAVTRDITAQRESQARQQLLMSELDHRVRNNLAAIDSLVSLTARTSETIPEFMKKFEGRISTMANVHDVLTRTEWKTVDLRELVALVLSPFSDHAGVTNSGPSLPVRQSSAQPLSLALHELATNAVKHGALAKGQDGLIEVKWDQVSPNTVRLDWVEQSNMPFRKPGNSGLGLGLVHGFIEKELGGNVEFDFQTDRVACVLEIPICDAV